MRLIARWRRPLVIATAIVFVVSTVFPVVAGFVKNSESWPQWWGVMDVSIACVLGLLVLSLMSITRGHEDKRTDDASYKAYRVLIHAIFAMLAVFALFGDWIVWGNCLTGLAWRYWLLLYSLPAWFAAFGEAPSVSQTTQQ